MSNHLQPNPQTQHSLTPANRSAMSSLIAMEEEGLLPKKIIARVRKYYHDYDLWKRMETLQLTVGLGIPLTILIGLVCLLAGVITFPIYCLLFFLWGFLQCIVAYSLTVEPLGLLEGLFLLVFGLGESYLLYAHPYFFIVLPSVQEELANHNTEKDLKSACYFAHFYLINSFLFFFAYYRKSLTCTLPSTLTMVRFLIFTVTLLLALHDFIFMLYFSKKSGSMALCCLLQMVLSLIGLAGVLTNERQREDDKFVEMDESEAEKVRLSSVCQLQISTGLLTVYNIAQIVMCTLGNVLFIILVCFGALTGEEAAFIYFHLGWAVVYMCIQVLWEKDLFTMSDL